MALIPSPLSFEPTRKRCFGSHSEMAHVWASGTVERGASSDDRMSFENGTVYSYGPHCAIARLLPFVDEDGRRVVLFTEARRSISTGKHINHVRNALRGAPVIIIPVPDLTTWTPGSRPEQVDAAWELLIRTHAAHRDTLVGPPETRRALAAFIELYDPDRKIPEDAAGWIERRDAEIQAERLAAEVAAAVEVLRGLSPTEGFDMPSIEALRALSIRSPSERIEGDLKRVRSALVVLRGREHKDLYDTGRAFVRRWTRLRDEWRVVEATFAEESARERCRDEVLKLLVTLRGWTPAQGTSEITIRYATGGVVQILENACRLGFPAEAIARIHGFLAVELALSEMPVVYPRGWSHPRAERITPEQWQDGRGGADQPFPATLVRRVGERLQTSRGAVVPFAAAVAVYARAARARGRAAPWRRNGETIRVGPFSLDAIDAEGNIVAGCHRIAFDEMERLAVREVPHLVRPRFPLPAVVA